MEQNEKEVLSGYMYPSRSLTLKLMLLPSVIYIRKLVLTLYVFFINP